MRGEGGAKAALFRISTRPNSACTFLTWSSRAGVEDERLVAEGHGDMPAGMLCAASSLLRWSGGLRGGGCRLCRLRGGCPETRESVELGGMS